MDTLLYVCLFVGSFMVAMGLLSHAGRWLLCFNQAGTTSLRPWEVAAERAANERLDYLNELSHLADEAEYMAASIPSGDRWS